MSNDCRLYLITPPRLENLGAFAADVERAVDAGDVACVQLRLKEGGLTASEDDVLRAAETLLPIAKARDIAFLINDNAMLAKKAGADGVHIGQGDTPYIEARQVLGDDATVGVTCHNSRHLAMEAGEAGADYVAFGAFFSTTTKDAPLKASVETLEAWNFTTTVPSVAIGGITPENCGPLVRAGADFLAVSGAVWSDENGPAEAVKSFIQAIETA